MTRARRHHALCQWPAIGDVVEQRTRPPAEVVDPVESAGDGEGVGSDSHAVLRVAALVSNVLRCSARAPPTAWRQARGSTDITVSATSLVSTVKL